MSSRSVWGAIWRHAAVGGALAVIVNLMIFAAAKAAGVSFTVPGFGSGAPSVEIPAAQVMFVTVVAFHIGTGLAAAA